MVPQGLFQVGDGDLPKVEHRGRQPRVHPRQGLEEVHKVLDLPRAPGGDHRDLHRLAHGGQHLQVKAPFDPVGVDGVDHHFPGAQVHAAADPADGLHPRVVPASPGEDPELALHPLHVGGEDHALAAVPQGGLADQVGDVRIGGGNFVMIAGPCSVESEEQIVGIAKAVKASGAQILRGGAFKPRTSPYDFQGLAATGLELLKIARQETGLPIVTEIMGTSALDLFADVDVIQVGARNMQNFDLLKELGRLRKPILLKRGLAATLKELLMSAEYIMAGGNEQIILCERGIRTFDDYTRNTLDLAAVPMLHELTHLPVIVDPSHSTGLARMVRPMALAAAACGTDGLIIEVHNDPMHALCDGAQSIKPEEYDALCRDVRTIREVAMR